MEGQYFDPARIVAFNTAKGWSRDVSEELANEVAERLAVERRDPCGTKQNVYISYSFFDALESSRAKSLSGTLRLSDGVNMSEIAVSFFEPFSLLHPPTFE